MLEQLTAQIDTLENSWTNGDIDVEQFFTKCEEIMDAALAAGSITDEEYCQLEMRAGF